MSGEGATAGAAGSDSTLLERMLGGIEKVGNKVPHPAILFLALIAIVIVLSQILYWANVSITYEAIEPPPHSVKQQYVGGSTYPAEALPPEASDAKEYKPVHQTAKVKGLLTTEGIRFLFTSVVSNFMGFTAMGIILIVMIGVGLSEASGLIGALIRRLVAVSSEGSLTYIIVFLGVISSIASDAGYLVLIPLGAVAFMSVGRHPLAGIAAAFAGVAAGFGVNFLITPTDAILTEITNEAIGLVNPGTTIDLTSNLYFGIGSTVLITIVAALITTRVVEPRLGTYDPAEAGEAVEVEPDSEVEVSEADEARGLRWAGFGLLGVLALIALVTLPPGAPLRNPETSRIIGTSPFMDSLVVNISLAFFVAGWCYGRATGTIRSMTDVINAITKSWAGLAGLLFLFLLIAQFIAYFNFSNMATVAAVKLGDVLEHVSIANIWLLIGVVIITTIVNIIIPQAIAKWALLAPIFVPLFIRLGIQPQTVLAAYRVGDSPTNVITPIMAYFPLIVVFSARYVKTSGIGTVIALTLPYALVLTVLWTLFFAAWYLLGIPMGPGSPV